MVCVCVYVCVWWVGERDEMVGDPLALSEEPGESEERAGVPLPLSTFDVRPAEDGCGGAEWVSLSLVSTPSLASMWARNQESQKSRIVRARGSASWGSRRI